MSSPYRRPSYGAGIEILREACVPQAGQPLSTLVEAGRIAAKRATAALKLHSAPSEVANDFGLLDGGRKSLARWPADNKR